MEPIVKEVIVIPPSGKSPSLVLGYIYYIIYHCTDLTLINVSGIRIKITLVLVHHPHQTLHLVPYSLCFEYIRHLGCSL